MERSDYNRVVDIGCKNLMLTKWGGDWIILDKETWSMIGRPERTKAAATAQAYDRQYTTYGGNIDLEPLVEALASVKQQVDDGN